MIMGEPVTNLGEDLSAVYRPQVLTPAECELTARAKQVIDTADRGVLTPDTFTKFQQCILKVLELSPMQTSTAAWVIETLPRDGLAMMYNQILLACQFAKSSGAGRPPKGSNGTNTPPQEAAASATLPRSATVGRNSNFSAMVKSIGLCRVTGDATSEVDSCHIIAFSSKGDSQRAQCYQELIKAMFGDEAWETLLTNVINGSKDKDQNINRLDNGIALSPSCHRAWDHMRFAISVDWSTYSCQTQEFDARFRWLGKPINSVPNCWGKPVYISPAGEETWPKMEGNSVIPFRRIDPPQLPDGRPRKAPPVPSAHLLYVRETLARIAHIIGVSGEYDDSESEDGFEHSDFIYAAEAESDSGDGDNPKTPSGHDLRPGHNQNPAEADTPAVPLETETALAIDHWLTQNHSSPKLSSMAAALDLAINWHSLDRGRAVVMRPRAGEEDRREEYRARRRSISGAAGGKIG